MEVSRRDLELSRILGWVEWDCEMTTKARGLEVAVNRGGQETEAKNVVRKDCQSGQERADAAPKKTRKDLIISQKLVEEIVSCDDSAREAMKTMIYDDGVARGG